MAPEIGGSNGQTGPTIDITLNARPERQLIRPGGSFRHIDFHVQVSALPSDRPLERTPLTLALVLDRSGSMSGDKIATARRAALAVVDRLDERDHLAVVVFDDRIDVLQPRAPVTATLKERVRAELGRVDARASTALHQGWLTGAQEIASDTVRGSESGLARIFLLTDGLANVGTTDPEQIASEAAGIRENAGIGTSTFGIGEDYNEALLGPMAVSGGGQFHHLRTAAEIGSTFVGELGDLLAVAASRVRLEIEVPRDVRVDVVSAYHTNAPTTDATRWTIAVGDLVGGEERHVVVRFGFPPLDDRETHPVRARVIWATSGAERQTEWQEATFRYADDPACNAEPRDRAVMRWVGLHHAERARREAAMRSRGGDVSGAREVLREVAGRIAEYATGDPDLQASLQELREAERELREAPLSPMQAKEMLYASQLRSRGQRDYRAPSPGGPGDLLGGLHAMGAGPAAQLVARYLGVRIDWNTPSPTSVSGSALRDHYRGALLGGAVGNALGRAAEGLDPAEIRARYGPEGIQSYVSLPRGPGGPSGVITGDTRLTIELARSLLAADGRFDPADFARRLLDHLPVGAGRATAQAVQAMAQGQPWWQAGIAANSAGNGAAMRVAPIGLACALNRHPSELIESAVASAFITHTHPVGVGAAVVMAAGVAACIRQALHQPARLDHRAFLGFVGGAIDGTEPQPTREQRPGGRSVRLSERIREVADLVRLASPEAAFRFTGTGAFALESVPAALYAFLRSPDDPRQAILTAVNAGGDADTIGSLAGNLAGAWCGAERLRQVAPEWLEELQCRDELIGLADGLADVAARGA